MDPAVTARKWPQPSLRHGKVQMWGHMQPKFNLVKGPGALINARGRRPLWGADCVTLDPVDLSTEMATAEAVKTVYCLSLSMMFPVCITLGFLCNHFRRGNKEPRNTLRSNLKEGQRNIRTAF